MKKWILLIVMPRCLLVSDAVAHQRKSIISNLGTLDGLGSAAYDNNDVRSHGATGRPIG
jgi:hypothetical protein